MAEEDVSSFEGTIAGQTIKARSKYMSEFIATFCLLLLSVLTWVLWNHMLDVREQTKVSMDQLKERDREIKEVFKEFANAQKEMVAAQREQNCLIALPQDVRENRAQFCKTLAR